jgi:hypothetical protein
MNDSLDAIGKTAARENVVQNRFSYNRLSCFRWRIISHASNKPLNDISLLNTI